MPYVIGCVSQKGGPGKSTLARALGAAFALNEWSVLLADLDTKQGTATAWQQRRLRAGVSPEVPVQMFGNVAGAVRKAGDADILIVDGAPHASAETVAIAKAAHLLLIPTGLSLDDLEPAVTLANTLADQHSIPLERLAFVLCKTGSSTAELVEARTYLGKTRFATLDGEIPQKPAFSRAMDAGLSVIETPYKAPREQALQVIQAAIARFETLIASA
ncbi:ParA family protein [Azotobacter beijerinckii]|uniref:Chromosome partitioning protein n=1 Tax=Azotobacter beijerinckii TaxID=170623 RepID=A0A1I1B978_9GAMM|nr:ParA family protein [Azotobacter beijerinckii]SFB46206.1 chromosome partitioning protein [Azotobacter beijerinckii]